MIASWTLSFWCRRCAVSSPPFRAVMLVAFAISLSACDGKTVGQATNTRTHEPRESQLGQELSRLRDDEYKEWASRYYQGYMADVLRGDVAQARVDYEYVIAEAGGRAPELAARAALRLAELEALAGQRRQAVELMARASVLGRNDLTIVERADRLHERLISLRAAGSDVRGPPIGTELEGVSERTSQAFASAEELLEAYYKTRLRPRLEQLRASVRKKENTMYTAVRAYQSIAEMPEPTARIAAEFRVASLHHDMALSLMFDLPPELEGAVAARFRRSYRASAIEHLKKARSAYRRTLDVPQDDRSGHIDVGAERWSTQATLALRSVEDLLGGAQGDAQ